ncbi:hypothetical protein BDV12DRAFT_195301 [Aspergillus spectabilis]
MDALFSKKTALRRRDSLSLLFGSQKPTFATLNEKPTRYYDFVDIPASKFSTPGTTRQDISLEEESKIRYACSLLAYRIEQGLPSCASQASARAVEDVATKAQLDSKFPSPKANHTASSIDKTGYDSGVGLTQQPSMQTMRVLHSRCGEPSDSGGDTDTRTVSVFSNTNTNTRTGTSCTNTSVLSSAEPSYTQSSSQSPRQNENELQTITGAKLSRFTQQHNTATKAFLTDSSPAQPLLKDCTLEDTETFLSPTIITTNKITNLSSETLQTNSSIQSLRLSRVPAQIHQSTNQSTESTSKNQYQTRSIIIDSAGNPRLLTPDEESQRNKALQQAVLAKMTPGFMLFHPVRQSVDKSNSEERGSSSTDHNTEARPQSRVSKLGFSWFGRGSTSGGDKSTSNVLRRKVKVREQQREVDSQFKNKDSGSVFGKLTGFLSRGEKV